MTIVQQMSELFINQTQMDEDAHKKIVDDALLTHPGKDASDFVRRRQRLISAVNGQDCPDCGEPEYTVRDQLTGRTEPRCRCCFNAIMRQSLGHIQYGEKEVCWDCKITYDSIGLITGAVHNTKPLEDETIQTDPLIIRVGIGPLLRAGRVDLTDCVLTILD